MGLDASRSSRPTPHGSQERFLLEGNEVRPPIGGETFLLGKPNGCQLSQQCEESNGHGSPDLSESHVAWAWIRESPNPAR
jgi:hypothetical protein